MSTYLKRLVSLPVKKLAEYLLDRFLGKFVGKIDLNREGTTFEKETLTLPDLSLNCRVLNEAMANTPLKFIKFHIGTLQLKVHSLRTAQVSITIKDIQVDLELQNETWQEENPFQKYSQNGQDEKSKKLGNSNKQKELFLVDMLVSNVLTNLEFSVENLAVRVVTREAKSFEDKVPTFLIRTHAISFQKNKAGSENEGVQDKKIDPLLPMSDLQCLLGNKKLAISDISVHLMKEKWLDPLEYHKPGQFSTRFNAFSFPYDYPTLNHPSAIILLKAPLGAKELAETDENRFVKLRDNYEYFPAITAQFAQEEPGQLSSKLDLPLFEIQLSLTQMKNINNFLKELTKKRKFRQTKEEESKKDGSDLTAEQIESLTNVKEDFASAVLSQNPELMQSMHEMFESQHQEYLMYSSVCDTPANTGNLVSASIDFQSPPLIGKGDGYSFESALKDSMHPDLAGVGFDDASMSMMLQSQGYNTVARETSPVDDDSVASIPLSNMPVVAALPVKQPLNKIKIDVRLGEFLVNVLCSEESSQDEAQRFVQDGLDEVIEQLIDEQGAGNENGREISDSSPFVLEHDRVFKAFGDQVNQEYPLQMFHLPVRTQHNEALVKSTAFEIVIKESNISLQILKEHDLVKSIKLNGSVEGLAGHRIDMILQARSSGDAAAAGGELRNCSGLQSSMMDMTLLSNDSDRFHSCYDNNNSTVYHDTSQFGMASVTFDDSVVDPLMQPLQSAPSRNIKNLFVFGQLTNVVQRFSSTGDFHICRSTFFEVVKLKKDNQKCVQFSLTKTQGASSQAETKIFVGKVFLNITDSELLLALSLKQPPKMQDNELPMASKQNTQPLPLQKQKTGLQFDGLEFDFKFGAKGVQALKMIETMTKKQRKVQDVLAEASCACPLNQSLHSLGLNTTQINFVAVSDKQPCLKLSQADVVAKALSKQPIALCTIKNFIVRFGPDTQAQRNQVDLSRISEESFISDTSFASQHNQTLMTVHRMSEQSLTNEAEILFHRASSSYDEGKSELHHHSYNYNPSSVHLIEEPIQNEVTIIVQQLAILIDHRELIGPIAEFAVEMDSQLKNLISIVDTVNIAALAQASNPELFFIQKRNKIGEPLRLKTIIDDLTVQTLIDDREALKLRFNKSTIDFKMQDRGAITSFSIGVKLEDFIVVDQQQTVCRNLGQGQSRLYERPLNYLTFAQELDQANDFLLVHPSQKTHSRPMLATNVQISFMNQGFMEERVQLSSLRSKLERLQNDGKSAQQMLMQIAMDFGEMKKNPASVICSVNLSHTVLVLSNQNLTLSQTIQKLAKKASKSIAKLKEQMELADPEDSPKIKPTESPQIDQRLQQTKLNLQVRDTSVLYTPVLARSKLSSVNLGGLLRQNDDGDELVRLNQQVALQLSYLKLDLAPKIKSINLQVRSLALHFITETDPQHIVSIPWRLQGTTTQQELQRRGFVPILAITDFQTQLQGTQMSVKLNQLSLTLAEDSVQHFIAFLKLVQVSISDHLGRLDDELFDNIENSQGSGHASMLVTYQGKQELLEKGDLSLIREQSAAQEESILFSHHSHRSAESRHQVEMGDNDIDQTILFGEDHPFQQMRQGCDDMFTVSVKPVRAQVYRNDPFRPLLQQQQVAKPRVNLLQIIDARYFEQPAESQVKADLQRYRKIHILSEQMKLMVSSLSFTFELGSIRLTLFCGKDFDFNGAPVNAPAPIVEARQTTQQISTNLAQTFSVKQSDVGRSSMPNLSNRHSIAQSRVQSRINISGRQDNKEVLLVEDNYMDENELAQSGTNRSYSRARNSHRKFNVFAKVEVQDLIATRRHFPDQVLLEELKSNEKGNTPTHGLKFKTFNLSARNFQVQFSHAKSSKYLLESPYSFRHHNILELTVTSEKSYEKNAEEHSILVFLRPTKLSVNRENIDFVDKLFKSTLAKSMGNLKMHTEDDFEVIDEIEEEEKEARSPESPTLNSQAQKNKTTQLIRNLVINETSLTLSLSVNKLLSFQNLTIPIREFRLQNSSLQQYLILDQAPGLPIKSVQDCVVDFYRQDILQNQKIAILKSFRPVHGLTYFGSSVLSPVYKPLFSAYQFGLNGFLVGLSEGFGDLYQLVADGSYDVGVFLVRARQ